MEKEKIKYITTRQAVKRANVSLPTIINWCKLYDLGIKIAGRWHVDSNKLDQILLGNLRLKKNEKDKKEQS